MIGTELPNYEKNKTVKLYVIVSPLGTYGNKIQLYSKKLLGENTIINLFIDENT